MIIFTVLISSIQIQYEIISSTVNQLVYLEIIQLTVTWQVKLYFAAWGSQHWITGKSTSTHEL